MTSMKPNIERNEMRLMEISTVSLLVGVGSKAVRSVRISWRDKPRHEFRMNRPAYFQPAGEGFARQRW